jgi:hypothetical protein
MTTSAINILLSMMGTFVWIMSSKINAVNKNLASVTIVLSLPTLISFFVHEC